MDNMGNGWQPNNEQPGNINNESEQLGVNDMADTSKNGKSEQSDFNSIAGDIQDDKADTVELNDIPISHGNPGPEDADTAIHPEDSKVGTQKHHRVKTKSNFLKYVSIVAITSIVTSGVVGGTLYTTFSRQLNAQTSKIQSLLLNTSSSSSNVASSSSNVVMTSSESGSSVVNIAKKLKPSIVGIRMTVGSSMSSYFNSGNNDSSSSGDSEGSGIIISKDGYILTNYHVVEYADPKSNESSSTVLEVFLSNNKQVKAKFIGGDSESDLAVIKVDATGLTAAELGSSSNLQVGESVVAIGNPLGIQFADSVTTGVVSALNRQVDTGTGTTMNYIQTDAAINPGNSGGALVNSQGQVVGINSAKISETGVEGLGFAIPIDDAKPIIKELMLYGYVKGRPVIGISGQEISNVMSQYYNLPVGIYVREVTSGSGADKAGIQRGDVIVSLAGKSVSTLSELTTVMKSYKAGDTVGVVVSRNGSKLNLKLTFGEDK